MPVGKLPLNIISNP